MKNFFRKVSFGISPKEEVPSDPLNWALNQLNDIPKLSWQGKIFTEKELRKLVQEAVRTKLQESGADFSAKRQIIHAAQSASMSFENEIVNALGLKRPDEMHEEAQQAYLKVVKEMERKIVEAVSDALTNLVRFPRNEGSDK